jgi:toxin ParE1/3/4
VGPGSRTLAGTAVKYPVRFRPEIPDDITEACRWYEGRSAGLGERFLRELKLTLSRITDMPEAYAKGDRDVRSARLHRFPYVVHFRIADTEVVVVAVMYGGRDPSVWQDRA